MCEIEGICVSHADASFQRVFAQKYGIKKKSVKSDRKCKIVSQLTELSGDQHRGFFYQFAITIY